MNKLNKFLAKTKQKASEKAAVTEALNNKNAQAAAAAASPPVSLDVVQTKVLEQWGAEEDEELIEESADVSRPPALLRPDESDDDEIDLPSNNVRGNFEWGKSHDKSSQEQVEGEETTKEAAPTTAPPPEPPAPEQNEVWGGLKFRKKKAAVTHDLDDTTAFPQLEMPAAPSPSELKAAPPPVASPSPAPTEPKRKKAEKKAAKASAPAQIFNDQKIAPLSIDDIYACVGKWPTGWKKCAYDEGASRSRYLRLSSASA